MQVAAAQQRIAADHRHVQQHLDRRLGKKRRTKQPMDVRAAVTAEKALQRGLRLARVDLNAESAGCTKRKPEELQLVRGLTSDVGRSEERRVGKECVSTCRYGW